MVNVQRAIIELYMHLGGLLSTQEARVTRHTRLSPRATLTLLSCLATSRVHIFIDNGTLHVHHFLIQITDRVVETLPFFFCRIHMFSKRENQGYYGFDVRFHTRVGESNWLSCFTDSLENIHRRALLIIDNRQFVGFLHKTKLSSIYTDMNLLSFVVPQWWNIKRCLQFRRNSNLQLSLLLFFCFSVVIQSGEFLASVLWEEENLKSWNAAISKYIHLKCFCCVRQGKAVILQHMWNLEWSNVELL